MPQPNAWSGNNVNQTWWASSTAASDVTIYPTNVYLGPPSDPRSDSPLEWLRRQVAEICGLARSA